MGIHHCTTCGKKLRYKTIWKVLILGREGHYRNVTCENCGTAYHIKHKSKVLYVILLTLPMLLNILFPNKLSTPVSLSLYILYMALVLILLPYLIKYEIEKIDQEKDNSIRKDS
ncbi:MAG: TIGR04104 family putative zinc finger protein [Clostridiaceae bacterium]